MIAVYTFRAAIFAAVLMPHVAALDIMSFIGPFIYPILALIFNSPTSPTNNPPATGPFPPCMLSPEGGTNKTFEIFTVGSQIGGYFPPGSMDGLGAFLIDMNSAETNVFRAPTNMIVRVLVNHEILFDYGSPYTVNNNLTLLGARISYLDINSETFAVEAAGLAYDTIYDCLGNIPNDTQFLSGRRGLTSFNSAVLIEAGTFGFVDKLFIGPEQDVDAAGIGRFYVGGNIYVLDVDNKDLYQASVLGRGAWENVAPIETGSFDHNALILTDDTQPYSLDNVDGREAAPLYLYVGQKNPAGNVLERNGLAPGQGKLYVLVLDDPTKIDPEDYNGITDLLQPRGAKWVEIDNSRNPRLASFDGSTGYDVCGYPTQPTLWTRAGLEGSFRFARLEDVSTNPLNMTEVVMAATGAPNFADGADTVGTVYKVNTVFGANGVPSSAEITILYDGDVDDAARGLRSPDNLVWSADGFVYVSEDETASYDQDGFRLFGEDAINPREAGIVKLNPMTGQVSRIAGIDRRAVLDPSATPGTSFDRYAGNAGEWETSGIIDVTNFFSTSSKTANCDRIFLTTVQARGIYEQPTGRITNDDLYEGGQLVVICT